MTWTRNIIGRNGARHALRKRVAGALIATAVLASLGASGATALPNAQLASAQGCHWDNLPPVNNAHADCVYVVGHSNYVDNAFGQVKLWGGAFGENVTGTWYVYDKPANPRVPGTFGFITPSTARPLTCSTGAGPHVISCGSGLHIGRWVPSPDNVCALFRVSHPARFGPKVWGPACIGVKK